MKFSTQFFFLPCILTFTSFYAELSPFSDSGYIKYKKYNSVNRESRIMKEYINLSLTLADIDAIADAYAPLNQIYSSKETISLRKNLITLLKANPGAIAIHWALLKNYANAPDFNGGYKVIALQYAGYIYSIDEYIGCLAYEYVYSKRKQPVEAEEWYEKSLNRTPPKNMYWQEIKYTNTAQFSIKIMGNFNNWKLQNMYENLSGTYTRKVMVPRCSHCIYKCIVDYNKVTNPSKISELTARNY